MNMFQKRLVIVLLSLLFTTWSCASGGNTASDLKGASKEKEVSRITGLSVAGKGESVEVTIKASGPIQYTVFKMNDPKRLILDMSNVDMSEHQAIISVKKAPVEVIRPYYFPNTRDARLQIDLDGAISYNIDNSVPGKLYVQIAREGVSLAPAEVSPKPSVKMAKLDTSPDMSATMGDPAEERQAAREVGEEAAYRTIMEAAAEEPLAVIVTSDTTPDMKMAKVTKEEPPRKVASKDAAPEAKTTAPETITIVDPLSAPATVQSVDFRQVSGMSRIEITMSKPNPSYELISRNEMKRLTIDLPNALVEKQNERLINVNIDESAVKNVAVFQFRGGDDPLAKVVVNLEEVSLYNVVADGNKITLDIGDEAVLAFAIGASEENEEGLVGAELVTGPKDEYTGVKISLDFQQADIHNILRILADVSGYNIITSGSVKGKVTMKLKDVPWDQAIEVILKNNGLDMIKQGKIIRVAMVKEIQAEKEAEEKRLETERKIEPLYTKVFEINYESAGKMKENIEILKSERGSVDINERTNMLIVKDTKNKLAEMGRLIEVLDKKEMQVLIESRIVEVTHDKARELGVQWGGVFNEALGNTFPNTVGVTGATGVSTSTGVGGYAVNLPLTGAATGGIGVTLGHINGTALLDARLMALENTGGARIVSMPKITTMNNKEAVIESGQEIPYQTISAEGTRTQFKKATLSLRVTPHITPDRHIRLEIETHKDEPDFSNQIPGAPPPIRTKQAITEVLVADGDTTVIGGLFKDTNTYNSAKVPGFGDIPYLGWLFKSNLKKRSGEELLIFITPKVVE